MSNYGLTYITHNNTTMKIGILTSVLATITLAVFTFFFGSPKKVIKGKDKAYDKTLYNDKEDNSNLFI